MFSKVIERVSVVSGWLSGIGIYVMTIIVFVDVLLRYFFGSPTMVADVISVYSMCFVSFVGAAFTSKLGRHVSVDLVYQKFSPRTKAWDSLLTNILVTIVLAVITWSTIEWVIYTYNSGFISSGTMGEPMWIPLSCIPIGFFLWTLQYIVECLKAVKTLRILSAGGAITIAETKAERPAEY
jgi:C4-dicarboxylate transporter DctQ subunit